MDDYNVLWLANNIEKLCAETLQTVALTLIICAASIMARSSTGFSIGVSKLNKILHQVMIFSLDQLTFISR